MFLGILYCKPMGRVDSCTNYMFKFLRSDFSNHLVFHFLLIHFGFHALQHLLAVSVSIPMKNHYHGLGGEGGRPKKFGLGAITVHQGVQNFNNGGGPVDVKHLVQLVVGVIACFPRYTTMEARLYGAHNGLVIDPPTVGMWWNCVAALFVIFVLGKSVLVGHVLEGT